MQIITDAHQLQQTCLRWRADGINTVLVPTMGYYHAGHESLMNYARSIGDKVIVSLFVNPTQFGPNEDLEAYPRDLDRDAEIANAQGVDILYAPQPSNMYHDDHSTWVEVPELASTLCGLSRPTHFRGVCTVVLKLLMLTLPHTAVFGQKDWQQLAIIRRMVRDFSIPVTIAGRPIVREASGLALSSRNIYLGEEEKKQAPHIHHSLLLAKALVENGERNPETIKAAIRKHWQQHLPLGTEDYLAIIDPDTLKPLHTITDAALCATAVQVGRARLLDNMLLLGECE